MAARMKEWSVGLEFTGQRGPVDPDVLFDLIEVLEDYHAGAASLSPDGTRIGVDLWVEAPTLRAALAASERAVLRALGAVGLAGMSVTAADAKPWAELEAELARPNYPELVGVAEMAETGRVEATHFGVGCHLQVSQTPGSVEGRPGVGPSVDWQLSADMAAQARAAQKENGGHAKAVDDGESRCCHPHSHPKTHTINLKASLVSTS